jgi:hypothetical protein
MMTKQTLLALAATVALAACGGGGSGGGGSAPAVPAPPPPANTSLAYYLPLAPGNVWTFDTGGSFRDLGSGTLLCGGCAIQGVTIEAVAIVSPSGTQTGIFYYAKGVYPSGTLAGRNITYLTGISNDGGNTILLTAYSLDGRIPGLGAIDDSPTPGEYFSFVSGAYNASATAAINSVGGAQSYQNTTIANVALTTLSSPAITPINFGFAQGVGFTSLSYQGQTTKLTSFSVSLSSRDRGRLPQSVRAIAGTNAATGAAIDSVVRGFLTK